MFIYSFSCSFYPTVVNLTHLFSILTTTSTTAFSSLSLHDALPISTLPRLAGLASQGDNSLFISDGLLAYTQAVMFLLTGDRKSTRLNSSHVAISYAVFCLKKKKSIKICVLL